MHADDSKLPLSYYLPARNLDLYVPPISELQEPVLNLILSLYFGWYKHHPFTEVKSLTEKFDSSFDSAFKYTKWPTFTICF